MLPPLISQLAMMSQTLVLLYTYNLMELGDLTCPVVSHVSNGSLYLLNPNAYVSKCLVDRSTYLCGSICPVVSEVC